MHKSIIKIIIIVLSLLSFAILQIKPISVEARVGGGGSSGDSGGSSSGGGGSSSSHSSSYNSINSNNPFSQIIGALSFIIISSSSIIVMRIRITKYRYNAIKDFKDKDWNYKEMVKRVEKIYFLLQKAWTKNDIKIVKDYLTKELYEIYKSKLEWMEIGNKRNVLKKVKLLNVYPISVADEEGNQNDKVYFYIKGRMIDYTINTVTNEIIEGNEMNNSFIEYWLFIKNANNEWVLSKIYQYDELGIIPY